jgi:thiamine biosynthesis lipoprotein
MKRLLPAIMAAIIAAATTACGSRGDYRDAQGAVWSTTYHITYRSDRDLGDSIMAAMRQVEQSLSPFVENSVISRINRGETDVADSLIAHVFTASQLVNSLSGGAFDPTVGPLVSLWGFGEGGRVDQAPPQAAIDSALKAVGINRCGLNGLRLTKASPDTRFNFSAITKGYGCDRVAETLRRNGCTDYMVEIGGEIALSGLNRRGEPWHIMIDAPVQDSTATHHGMTTVAITDRGIATSGNYRNYHRASGITVGHIISPVTGWPIVTSTLSATVIAPTTMMADALATACMAMDVDQATAMIGKIDNASALIVTADSLGQWQIHTTPGFPLQPRAR